MRYRINEQLALTCMPKRGPEGPLAAHFQSFAQVLSELGYTRGYLCQHLMLVARFSHWLGQLRRRINREPAVSVFAIITESAD